MKANLSVRPILRFWRTIAKYKVKSFSPRRRPFAQSSVKILMVSICKVLIWLVLKNVFWQVKRCDPDTWIWAHTQTR